MSQTVISRCDPAEILDPSEHALDGVAVTIEMGREAILPAPVGLGRDVRCGTFALDLSANGVGIVAFVTVEDRRLRHQVEQLIGGNTIRYLTAGQEKGDRSAQSIGQGVDFGRATATRTTDRLVEFPPFPPEALRCAFTADESIMSWAGGPPVEASA